MSGSEHARPVWLDDDDEAALLFIVNILSPGFPDLGRWATSMRSRRDAAPADPTEAAWHAMRQQVWGGYVTREELADVLEALGCAKDPA